MALYELQKIDSKIDEINKVKGELPLEVQDLEDEMTGLRTRIDNINAEIEELNTLTKQRKREVDQAKILIGNYIAAFVHDGAAGDLTVDIQHTHEGLGEYGLARAGLAHDGFDAGLLRIEIRFGR